MIVFKLKQKIKDKKEKVGNKFLALMLLNSLMRTEDKPFLDEVSSSVLKRLKLMAKNNQNHKGLNEFTDGDLSKSEEAKKFYYLLK